MPRVSLLAKIPYGSPEYMAASEHMHQSAFVELVDTQFTYFKDLFYAVPNGGSRNKIEAINLVLEGVKAGIPDMHFPVGTFWDNRNVNTFSVGLPPPDDYRIRYLSLYLEFKDMKTSSKPSDKQVEKIRRLREYGNAAFVVHGWKQAEAVLLWYFGRMQPSEVLMTTGLNLGEQLDNNYSLNSWRL